MGQAKRVTCRNMRKTKTGRLTTAEHIDKRNDTPEKRAEVKLSRCVDFYGKYLEGDLATHELDYYREHFQAGLDAQNARYKKKGNYGRIRTMEQYLEGDMTGPEDTLYYIGCMGNTADGPQLLECYQEFLEWRWKKFPNVRPLGFGVHKEKGAWHIEEHHVWVGHDADGHMISDQGKALKEMGVKPPDPTKPTGRYNNPKMTYTAACREKWIEIAKAHGFEIIEEPRERGRSGLSLEAYVTRSMKEQREAELVDVTRAIVDAERELGDLTEYRSWKRDKAAQEAQEAARKEKEAQEARKAQEAARKAQEAQEQTAREQQAREAAQAARKAEKPKTREELYREAMSSVHSSQAAPPKRGGQYTAMSRLRQKTDAADREKTARSQEERQF